MGLPVDAPPIRRLYAAAWTDPNWTAGVWKLTPAAGFFVRDLADTRGFGPGTRLRFAGSGERTVTAIDGRNVWIDGPPLDPARDGCPQLIEIVEFADVPAAER